ncbi:helix-turn-helix domain-containing protein [Dehalogenimonas alkenigignens]|uniref:helix-turn-helix domain-containing protein n=1 Tax=Dehalogenimonas alkenigignens TaxID=1217799 RepID=UPI001F0B7FFE|nr:helix-turn-helix domain-containing protein [Dehalogenimonas alkenigignens]
MKEACEILNISINTLRRWCYSGLIKSWRISARGDLRVTKQDVLLLTAEIRRNGFSNIHRNGMEMRT